MANRRPDLVVIASTSRDLPLWSGVLQDWSALGLIGEVILLDGDSDSASSRPCMAIREGQAHCNELSTELAHRDATDDVQVVCVSEMGEHYSSIGPVRGGAVRRAVRSALPNAQLVWVHAIAVSVPDVWPHVGDEELAWVGAHNVLLAPENAKSQARGVAPVRVADRARPLGITHHAATLCSVTGLWRAAPVPVFEGEPDAGGGQLVSARTFTRHLDVSALQQRLLSTVIDVEQRYPAPTRADGRHVQRIGDGAEAADVMAEAIWQHHPELRATGRSQVVPPRADNKELRQAVARFFAFLLGVVRGAPKSMLEAMVSEVSAHVARASQTVMFGRGPSAVTVTVNGIGGISDDGTLQSAEAVDRGLDQLLAQLGRTPAAPAAESSDAAQLWRDLVAGALTLVDGQGRREYLPVPQVGASDAVVADPEVIAPGPSSSFPVPVEARAAVDVAEIAPYDHDLAGTVQSILRERALTTPEKGARFEQLSQELQQHFAVTGRTYVGAFGRRLAAQLAALRSETVEEAAALGRLEADPSIPQDWNAAQVALGKVLLAILGVTALAALGTMVLAGTGALDWADAVLGSVAILMVGWMLALWTFIARQRQYFRALHARRAAADQVAVHRDNLAAALHDLRRVQSMHRQFLGWARILGHFVREPWGTTPPSAGERRLIGPGFGLNHRFGTPMAAEDGVQDLAGRVQSLIYPVGWMGEAWDLFLADVPSFPDSHIIEEDPERLYSLVRVADRTLLELWGDAVVGRERVNASKHLAARLRSQVSQGELAARLVTSVRSVNAQGQSVDTTLEGFVDGLDADAHAGRFSEAVFRENVTGEPWEVARAIDERDGEDGTMVLTQVSRAFKQWDLRFAASSQGAAPSVVWSDTVDPPQV